jgi:hypothetical protein
VQDRGARQRCKAEVQGTRPAEVQGRGAMWDHQHAIMGSSACNRACVCKPAGSVRSRREAEGAESAHTQRGVSLGVWVGSVRRTQPVRTRGRGFLWVTCGLLVGSCGLLVWVTCGLLVGYLWVTCVLLVCYLWVTCGLLVGYLWVTCGLLVGYLWVTCGLLVGYLWVLVGYLWVTCGLLVGYLWVLVCAHLHLPNMGDAHLHLPNMGLVHLHLPNMGLAHLHGLPLASRVIEACRSSSLRLPGTALVVLATRRR